MYTKIIKVEQKLIRNRTPNMLISFPTTRSLLEYTSRVVLNKFCDFSSSVDVVKKLLEYHSSSIQLYSTTTLHTDHCHFYWNTNEMWVTLAYGQCNHCRLLLMRPLTMEVVHEKWFLSIFKIKKEHLLSRFIL